MLTLIIALVIVVILALIIFAGYNSLIRLREQSEEGWAQIDVQLQRRHDLIPNLVNTVKGYAAHEKETLNAVIEARNTSVSASNPAEAGRAEGELNNTLSRLFALAESYPDLKANTNFQSLQEELATTENKVSFARQYYNSTVQKYNAKLQQVPFNIISKLGSFSQREYFELPSDSVVRDVPIVKF